MNEEMNKGEWYQGIPEFSNLNWSPVDVKQKLMFKKWILLALKTLTLKKVFSFPSFLTVFFFFFNVPSSFGVYLCTLSSYANLLTSVRDSVSSPYPTFSSSQVFTGPSPGRVQSTASTLLL